MTEQKRRPGRVPGLWPLVEDTEYLLVKQGQAPALVCERLGVTPATLARTLYRYGRRDLARPFARIDWGQREVRRRG